MMTKLPQINLNSVLASLENYKRHIGRRYNAAVQRGDESRAISLMHEYNKIENQIAYLCIEHGCERHSKPYKLGINAPVSGGFVPDTM